MSRAQTESVIKNIIREIAHECATKGESVSETLVAFMVKAIVLDPQNMFHVDRTLTKDDVQKLIQLCVHRLLDKASPSLDTIKMQVYFDMNYTTRSDFLDEHHKVLDQRLQPVMREITDSRAKAREELEILYRKIVSSILLRSGLGSVTDIGVVREATAALQSVFPQSELGSFLALQKKDKERQLQELTMIVTGIRLFNKDCGKGGEGIDDLPAILNEAVPTSKKNIDSEIQFNLQTVCKYIALVEKFENQSVPMDLSIPLLQEAIINCRQMDHFLRILLDDVLAAAKQVESLESQLSSRMQQLHLTVQSKTAVPTAQVYPQFIHLAQIWTGFQDEMVLLSVASNILVNMQPLVQGHREKFNDSTLEPYTENLVIKSDEDRLNETRGSEHRILPQKETRTGIEWLFPESINNFNRLPLQFRGFCGWTIVNHDRLLLPANREIGVLQYKDLCYGFCSKTAAEQFAGDPETYIRRVTECAKRSPELIQLLELHNQFASITPYAQSKDQGKTTEKLVTKCDGGTQTDTHFYESNIVVSYEWNEWELRRKALKLANLRQKATHSVQTNLSNMRRDNATQCYLPKELSTQTKKESYTNVPKPQVFHAGLRGGGRSVATVMTKIDLTLDVNQT